MYFQDEYPASKSPSREYFYNILNTLYPDYLKMIIQHAQKVRYGRDETKEKAEAITVTEEWMQILSSMPYTSCKYPFKLLFRNYIF